MADSERKRVARREVLAVLGAGIGAALAGCSSPASPTTNGSSGGSGTSATGCLTTASETAGPYPDTLGMISNAAFYRRVFLHETIAKPRMFPGLLKPVGLMAADFPAMKEKVFERYPMMRSTAFERRMLFERGGRAARPARVAAAYDRASIVPSS